MSKLHGNTTAVTAFLSFEIISNELREGNKVRFFFIFVSRSFDNTLPPFLPSRSNIPSHLTLKREKSERHYHLVCLNISLTSFLSLFLSLFCRDQRKETVNTIIL